MIDMKQKPTTTLSLARYVRSAAVYSAKIAHFCKNRGNKSNLAIPRSDV